MIYLNPKMIINELISSVNIYRSSFPLEIKGILTFSLKILFFIKKEGIKKLREQLL